MRGYRRLSVKISFSVTKLEHIFLIGRLFGGQILIDQTHTYDFKERSLIEDGKFHGKFLIDIFLACVEI